MEQQINEPKNAPSCGCDDHCCQPKKKTILPKLIFSVIIIAAVAIILFKLLSQSSTAAIPHEQLLKDPSTSGCIASTDNKNEEII